ncbi:uncharacterized protein V6R79_005829 [Siganus canaliculatus]
MISLTMIGRVADGLPLAASVQEDEQTGRDLQQYQNQAKQLCRKLSAQSPDRCTVEAGDMNFHYIIAQGVCYLVLCNASFPKKMAFAYLEDLHSEFYDQYGRRVPTVTRPYSFIEFGEIIQCVIFIKRTEQASLLTLDGGGRVFLLLPPCPYLPCLLHSCLVLSSV